MSAGTPPRLPRRLLVELAGVVHTPDCARVPIGAEHAHWGHIEQVAAALREFANGRSVNSTRPYRNTPGPTGINLCELCCGDLRAPP